MYMICYQHNRNYGCDANSFLKSTSKRTRTDFEPRTWLYSTFGFNRNMSRSIGYRWVGRRAMTKHIAFPPYYNDYPGIYFNRRENYFLCVYGKITYSSKIDYLEVNYASSIFYTIEELLLPYIFFFFKIGFYTDMNSQKSLQVCANNSTWYKKR